MKKLTIAAIIVISLLLSLTTGCDSPEQTVIYKNAPSNNNGVKDNDLTWQDIYMDNILSVAKVHVYQCTWIVFEPSEFCIEIMTGSGFVVADNVLATNWHIGEYYSEVDLYNLPDSVTYYRLYVQYPAYQTLDNNEFLQDRYEVEGSYSSLKQHDLALLKVNTLGRTPVKLSQDRWEDLEMLTEVMAMGYPLYFEFVATTGTVGDIFTNEDIYNDVYWITPDTKLIKHDAQIDGGNSGGPLFNKKGEVIGINFASLLSQQTAHSFALTADYLRLVDLDNINFDIRVIRRPEDFTATRLFYNKGELNPVWESETYGFTVKAGCMYKFHSSGDDFADDNTPQQPAFTNLDLWIDNGTWIIASPDWNSPIQTFLNYQAGVDGNAYLSIYINQYYLTDPGWYELSGWEFCPAN
ncbi:MAG: trypsin-like peptidase domain-containing protein [Candidatus Parcubacteria bacterium]|nr:trypsin-like peptidase domain-containing protein [Candidatus Parcubacteria bacterium]